VLEERGATGGTDVLGTLGGRIKRRWVGQRRKADAELAQALYQQGYDRAAAAGDHAQAYYHAINLAFLQLCFHHDVAEARRVADTALEHCAADEARITAAGLPDRGALWRIATEAEARLVRGETDQALGEYRRAVGLHPDPWQALSMYWQARLVAEELGDEAAIEGLDALFGLKGTE
jgi:hypothetical protein